jgi:hypothetical protein
MIATGIAAPTTLAFIGGISGMEVILLVGLLVSCSILFVAMQNEYSTGKSLMLTAGLYVAMALWGIMLL